MKRIVVLLAAITLAIAGCSDAPTEASSASSSDCPQPSSPSAGTWATTAQVLEAVKAAQCVHSLPQSVAAGLSSKDEAGGQKPFECQAAGEEALKRNNQGECALGDPNGTKLMVIYGDSRAHMWAATLEGVAAKNGWKLRVFSMGSCPVPDMRFIDPGTKAPYELCDWHHSDTPTRIIALHPDLVLVSSVTAGTLVDTNTQPTAAQWQDGWARTLAKFDGMRVAMLGSYAPWGPGMDFPDQAPLTSADCLAQYTDIQKCSIPADEALNNPNLAAEKNAAAAANVLYVPTTSWVCAGRCEPVIAGMRVFNRGFHFTPKYAVYLTGALDEALKPVLK